VLVQWYAQDGCWQVRVYVCACVL